MKIKTVGGVCLFGTCLLLASLRDHILEMEHVAGVDTAYYIGLASGAMVTLSFMLLFFSRRGD